MASKFGLAGGIPERRVRPIWDAIDSRQFKNALKQSTALLAKYPNSPYALALKALVLERMGKCDESLSVSLQAKDLLYQNDSTLMDDLTLSTLQIVFQRLDRLDLATSCYEYACGKYHNNMDHMMGLFNCYVREYSFVKQQQTAIKMYKHAGEERFLLWAVCSIQLQVLCGNGGEKLLLLAEGLLKKHVASHSLHEPEALIVYISILEQQAKYGDALEILSGTLGSLLVIEVDKLRIQGRLLARQGDYTAAAQIYKKVLELSPDDWECFLHYLGCLLEDDSSWCNAASSDPIHPQKSVDCKFSHLTDEVFNSRISEASTSVKKLHADTSVNLIRCPYLANLEIERRKLLYGKNNNDELMEAVLEYFLSFGHLACFTSDVEDFLLVLSLDKKTELLERLKSSSTSHSTESIKELGWFITLKKIQELIGNTYKLPVDELERSAVQMSEMYCKSLPLSKDLDPQESIHGEELLSMASNVLVQLFWRTSNYGYFMEAIMVLEFGLTVRRHAWQYKVLLVHLYSHLGALPLAYEWYKALDVKNILMETVSHHILPQMLVSSLWVESNNLLRDYLRFMDDHLRESADLTFLAYRHRNYSKVIEFVQFKERLQRSSQYLVARVESSILQLKQNANNIEEEESVLENLKCGVDFLELSNEIGSKSVTFNEDWQSRPWWTPTPDKNYLLGPFAGISYCPKENLMKEREASILGVVERKSLLPRLIYLSIQTASACVKENFEVNGSICDPKVLSELKYLLDRYAKMLGFSLRDAIEVVSGVSSGLNSSEAFGADMVGWLNFAVFLNAWNLSSHEVVLPDVNGCRHSTWQVVNTLLKKCILEVRSMESLVCYPQLDLSVLVQLVTEPLAWHTLVMQSCVRSSLPSGKKKKRSGSADHSTSPLSHDIRGSVQSTSGVVEEVAKWLGHHIKKSEDEKLDAIFSSLEANGRGEGPGQVFRLLGTLISSLNEAELGDRISQAMKSWSPVDVARKFVAGQRAGLSAFLRICESKIKSLQALKQQMAQV
ncbi:N-terminal acetyltransferase B complex auxiliary subunit NAA25 [Citrus sinensis]|uniref:N-terminal acetyltransferase B complex auxiliary subunit NAA25 isoform X1 n=1 Tax=Citrus sinensis TaxID=2711 RepID=UPI0021927C74|nr:N-terminal acetyltransferase B complex auxiliary subunit NAA25 isoform X1 [Citrus sinensis]KAH9662099.1 N-terminal acetyltransferase B complex auxiliary subunit NAA25 [Citrus sinensis]